MRARPPFALPRARQRVAPPALARFAPSRRSLAVGVGLARRSPPAPMRSRGRRPRSRSAGSRSAARPPTVQQQVQRALAPLVGTNLLALDGAALERRAEALPDRRLRQLRPRLPAHAPHPRRARASRSRCSIAARRPGSSRRGGGSSSASRPARIPRSRGSGCRGRPTSPSARSSRRTAGGTAARTLALAARFPARIATVSLAHGELVFRLRSGLELRLGDPTDVRLKLAIARRALAQLPTGATYVDVSVPGRPVAGVGQPSTLK